MLNQLQMLKGKEVEVDFHGTLYRGVLTDIGEDEIFLKSQNNWITLSMWEIGDVRLVSEVH
jgi:ferredoxin-fold anticodon binding domain-containing protein